MKTEVISLGIEIEGEFHPDMKKLLRKYGVLKGDGSLRPCSTYSQECYLAGIGTHMEFASNILDRKGLVKFNEIFDIFIDNPKMYHWNESCGLHIHVGFRNRNPVEIVSEQFFKFFKSKFIENYPKEFKKRSGDQYCNFSKMTDHDIIEYRNSNDRYKAINYNALPNHGTVEFRIFPATTPEKMKEYALFIIDSVEEFLATNPKLVLSGKIRRRGRSQKVLQNMSMSEKVVELIHNEAKAVPKISPVVTVTNEFADEYIGHPNGVTYF